MTQIRKGPAGVGEADDLSGSENVGIYSATLQKLQGRPKDFDGARVVIERTEASFIVKVLNRPWGFRSLDRECFSPSSAEKYADALRDKLTILQLREDLRRQKAVEAKLRERLRLLIGGAR